jgi:hypothetical protein
MVKITKIRCWPDGALIDAHEGWGKDSRIRKQLESDCFTKCYICEDMPKDVDNLTVDHIISKDNNPSLEHVWENLLLACKRCNHEVKGNKYNGIINPCKIDPEDEIFFGMSHNMRNVDIKPVSEDPSKAIRETIQLLNEVYSDRMLTQKLAKEIRYFIGYIQKALSGEAWAIEYIQDSVKRCSEFAAFKRKIVRDDHQLSDKFAETLL